MSEEPPILPPAPAAGKRASVALAIAVHLALAAFLFYGVRWQTKVEDAVEVELVRAPPANPAPAPPPEPPAVAPAPTPPPVAAPEPTPPPRPDIALKDTPKPPPKGEPAKPRPDPFQDQLRREAEQLAQRKQADSAVRELDREMAARASAARNKAVADYLARIRGKIRGNIVLPPDIKGNPEAVFEVTQLPSGEVIGVNKVKSSGNPALDAAVERAILKSSPLPKPERGDVFDRLLRIPYRPLED